MNYLKHTSSFHAPTRHLQTWIANIGFIFIAICIHGQAIPAEETILPTSAKTQQKNPSQDEIDQAVTTLLLCEWPDVDPSFEKTGFWQVLKYIDETSRKKGDKEIVGKYRVLGQDFHRIFTAGGEGGGGVFGWSATASRDNLVKALEERGFKFPPMLASTPELVGEKIVGEKIYRIWITPGQYSAAGQQGASGVTMACNVKITEEAWRQRKIEENTLHQIHKIVESGEQQPKEWAERIFADGNKNEMAALARYKWLEAAQIAELLQSGDRQARESLIKNRESPLSATQIDNLIGLKHERTLLRHRYDQLTDTQLKSLRDNPATRDITKLAEGGVAAHEVLKQKLHEGNDIEIELAFMMLRKTTPEIVDIVDQYGTPWANKNLRKYQPAYTPAQVEKMLAGDDVDTHVYILKQKDIPLTVVQYERGMAHPNHNIAFWYSRRDDHTPSARLIEEGLTNSDPAIRSRWLHVKHGMLTPAQVKRALLDEADAVRYLAYTRKEITLTDAQLDTCLRESSFSVRDGCVQRPEMTLTQERFETIVGDVNPNLFRGFLRVRKDQHIDFAPYVVRAVAGASDETLLRMKKFEELLPITTDDIRTVCHTRVGKVQTAYCKKASVFRQP